MSKKSHLEQLLSETEQPGFWDDPDAAQKHMQRVSQAREAVEPWEQLSAEMEDIVTLAQLAEEETDESLEQEIEPALKALERRLEELMLRTVLSGRYDSSNAILSINAGAGGTESCDWAEILLRMYRFWAEGRGYTFEIVAHVEGDAAGLRNVTATVNGPFAYGYLKAEAGVHRLVRLSPFDSSKRRHTSFASVDVIPEIEEDAEIDLNPDDLRVDTYRSSGAGGQHVNKTDSAVRITHIPTGITAQCQNERSQHSNRRTAMNILRAKLYDLQRQEQDSEISGLRGDKGDIAFANQIRSYVMQPYTMVKDHRTDVETADVAGVLNGDIDLFIRTFLQSQAGKSGEHR